MTSLPPNALALLKQALAEDALSLAYQPQVELDTGRIVAWEALSRWHHAHYGTISPEAFIPLAEQHGLIAPLGQWLWGQATKDLPILLSQYPDTRLSINVSMIELRQVSFFSHLHNLLVSIAPQAVGQLEIELTESAYLDCTQSLILALEALQNLGITLAIDDFGTGHSNIERLHALPFNKIKLDKSYIANLNKPQDKLFIKETVQLAALLNKTLICEGIETQQQAKELQDIGVLYGQGYLFGKPMPLQHWMQPNS